ncbi:hypothetical protein B1748_19975 [Paenibacillus sp. MY03]|uniref:hypothetical protein n=1 Tax=Paenibacillus sp. MY03 TaxID=302980 RepID=UPI000B3C27F6|nr:hypothetical protein [Paenibacillus sp. MY03]OUS74862.1 hypothetical protein B1748_19975 [Paenibacillus sp. MY03]
MTPEELLEVLKRYSDYTAAVPTDFDLFYKWAPIVSPIVSLILVPFSIYIVYRNVDRTQKKNRENDILKQRRDLELKSAEEMLEELTKVKITYQDIIGIKLIYEMFVSIGSTVTVDSIKSHIAKCMVEQHKVTNSVASQFRKRRIILKDLNSDIEKVYNCGSDMGDKLNQFYKYFSSEPGHTDNEIMQSAAIISQSALDLTDHVNQIIDKLQDKYFAPLFVEKS